MQKIINNSSILVIALVLLVVNSCSQEQAVPVVVDFAVKVVDNDYSIPVTVVISNTTTGAESYTWSLEGADRTSSTDRNPGTIVYTNAGTYKIRLEASNTDGSKDSKEIILTLDKAVVIDFTTEIQINNFAPATVKITNTTREATTYQWTFEGGIPATSNQEQPENVVFNEPGDHTIKLIVGNGRETHELEKNITVGSKLLADFDWEINFEDDDLQIPVTMTLQNKSTGALTYNWSFTNANPANSTNENPTVTFSNAGIQTLSLTASNGKETQTITKTLELFQDTNLRTFNNVQFGINTAHNTDTIGAFFSTTTREIYNKTQTATLEGSLLDIVFFGLGTDFSFNKFLSPDNVSATTFEAITNAGHTLIINSQEQCACGTSLSVAQFDAMVDDSTLNPLLITETIGGSQHFTNAVWPRIVLFQTADGRKGAIKIKEYVSDAQNSYIITDIKIQKKLP